MEKTTLAYIAFFTNNIISPNYFFISMLILQFHIYEKKSHLISTPTNTKYLHLYSLQSVSGRQVVVSHFAPALLVNVFVQVVLPVLLLAVQLAVVFVELVVVVPVEPAVGLVVDNTVSVQVACCLI